MFEDTLPLGIEQALPLCLSSIHPLGTETIDLAECGERVAASSLRATVDSPSINASLKDGYAVISQDIAHATQSSPVPLQVSGWAAAGGEGQLDIFSGTTARVLTGAKIPDNADAVLAEEFTRQSRDPGWILALNSAEQGLNILPRGSDVLAGQAIIQCGHVITPGLVGYLASAGHSRVPVFEKPAISILATGNEIVTPGRPLPEGKLYASNLATLDAWCRRYNLNTRVLVVQDDPDQLSAALDRAVSETHAVITSGGAWTGERDMVIGALEHLGWKQIFHRIRIGPGKAVGFGLLRKKPVFVLPGGPPSNLTAFLQVALPGLCKLSGRTQVDLPRTSVRMAQKIHGRSIDWTQYVFGRLEHHETDVLFHPLRKVSRLQSMAEAEAVVSIPEGQTEIARGHKVLAQWLL